MTSFLRELRRRNVFKVAVAYAIVGWLLIQIAATVLPIFETPGWILPVFTFLLILGFPIALIFSWAYELTPEGLERTKAVPKTESIAHVTGRKLDFVIISLLATGIVFLAVDYFVLEEVPATAGRGQVVDRSSIAVLPFDNRSAREEDQFFVDGIHDDILTQLARIGSMKVISRTSVMGYRDTDKNMRAIGEELGVATILEGGVQRAGDTIRINVQLIDTATDEHLWAETYDRMLTVENVFAIQSEMAAAIATALRASLSLEDVARLTNVPTRNSRAYDFYLRGNDYYGRPNDQTFMPLAVEMYGQAVAEDPDFALAWAALSRAHINMHWYAIDTTPARLDAAEQAVQHALAIDPDLPEAHFALGAYYDRGFRDYDRAQREFAIAERAIPGDPELIQETAYMLRRMGDWSGALTRLERLLDRDPRNADLLGQLAVTSTALQRYAEAETYISRELEIVPDDSRPHVQSALLPFYRDGDVGRLKAIAANPPAPLGAYREYFGWYAAFYERDDATALVYIDRLEADAISVQSVYLPKPLLYGWTHKLAGQDDLAEPEFRAAITRLEAELATNPADPRRRVALAQALAGLGDGEAAERTAREAMALLPRSRDDLAGRWYELEAIRGVFAPLGDVEATVEELDPHLGVGSSWSIEGLLPDPRFDPVREDPRFQALVERYRRRP